MRGPLESWRRPQEKLRCVMIGRRAVTTTHRLSLYRPVRIRVSSEPYIASGGTKKSNRA